MVEEFRPDTHSPGVMELKGGGRKKTGKELHRPQRKRLGVLPGLDSQGDAYGLPGKRYV